jgi:hypothetical protein
MKKSVILLLGFACFIPAYAIDRDDVITAVKELKTACATPDFALAPRIYGKAARLIAYIGEDRARKYKEAVDYTKEEDQRGVDQICERINNKIGPIDSWGELMTRKKRGDSWYAIEVQHEKKGRPKKNIFAFVEIGGKLYLGDID